MQQLYHKSVQMRLPPAASQQTRLTGDPPRQPVPSYQSTLEKEPDFADIQLEHAAHSNLIQIHEYTNCVCVIWKAGNSLSMYAGAGNRDIPINDSFCFAYTLFYPARLSSSLILGT